MNRLPDWDWKPSRLLVPCSMMLLVAQFAVIGAFRIGALGYQSSETVAIFSTTMTSFALMASVANFLLWWAYFKAKKRSARYYVVLCLLIAYIIYSALISGNRGALLSSMIAILMAYLLSGRRISFRQGIAVAIVLIGVLLGGMIYGSIFRTMKPMSERLNIDEYFSLGRSTMLSIRENDLRRNLVFGINRLFERFENLSSLAVIVANYRELRPLEEHYGLANNIWTDTWTAIIPRFIWPQKPVISNARAFGALYFNFGDNAFAITPIGDFATKFWTYRDSIGNGTAWSYSENILCGVCSTKAFRMARCWILSTPNRRILRIVFRQHYSWPDKDSVHLAYQRLFNQHHGSIQAEKLTWYQAKKMHHTT